MSMAATMWSISTELSRAADILRLLKEARHSVRAVDVRLFNNAGPFTKIPTAERYWRPVGALLSTAEEISKYITDSGSAEACIVASDEV